MKFAILICSLYAIVLSCKPSPAKSTSKQASHNIVAIEYTATSRSNYASIKATARKVFVTLEKDKAPAAYTNTVQKWETLLKSAESITVEAISSIEAPSKAFQYDGAAIAHLKITKNNTTYTTQAFDHGNPPKEIETLIKALLSLRENIE